MNCPTIALQLPAHLRSTFILAEKAKPHFVIRIRRLGGQLQAHVSLRPI
jgi:hypothetical protein